MDNYFKLMFYVLAVAVFVVVFVAAFRADMDEKNRRKQEQQPEAPYKLEPQEQTDGYPPLDMAFPDNSEFKPKRKYTKRSKYWGSARQKARLKEARKAKRKAKFK